MRTRLERLIRGFLFMFMVGACVINAAAQNTRSSLVVPRLLPEDKYEMDLHLSASHGEDAVGKFTQYTLIQSSADIKRVWVYCIFLDQNNEIVKLLSEDLVTGEGDVGRLSIVIPDDLGAVKVIFFPFKIEVEDGFFEVPTNQFSAAMVAANTKKATQLVAVFTPK